MLIAGISCRYGFSNAAIDYGKIKTIKISYIENKARYINPLLSPRLTDKLQQVITQQTRLVRTNDDDAHVQISGYISQDDVNYVAVSGQTTATNRITISAHIVYKNTVEEGKSQEFDISRSFDFNANQNREQYENSQMDDITKNLSDEIFNKIFSDW